MSDVHKHISSACEEMMVGYVPCHIQLGTRVDSLVYKRASGSAADRDRADRDIHRT